MGRLIIEPLIEELILNFPLRKEFFPILEETATSLIPIELAIPAEPIETELAVTTKPAVPTEPTETELAVAIKPAVPIKSIKIEPAVPTELIEVIVPRVITPKVTYPKGLAPSGYLLPLLKTKEERELYDKIII